MATRTIATRLYKAATASQYRLLPHRCLVSPYLSPSFRFFSDFGDSKPDAATDLSTSTKPKSKKEKEIDPSLFTVKIEVKMPAMGTGGGKVLKWYKQKGDIVKHEDVLCDIETADFTFGMETDDENIAIMGDILVEAPSNTVKDDEVLCILLHEESKSKVKVTPTEPN